MEETKSKTKKIVVVDANVVISSLISREGITQAVLSLLLSLREIKVIIPASIKEEVFKYAHLISKKSGVRLQTVKRVLSELFSKMGEIDECKYASEDIEFYGNFVRDESDIPLIIVAYAHRPCFVVTYNKSDFRKDKLEREGIYVVTPKEMLEALGMEVAVKSRIKTKRGFRIFRSIMAVSKKRK